MEASDQRSTPAVVNSPGELQSSDEKLLALTREDLATSVAAYRQGLELRRGWKAGLGVPGGILGGAGLIGLGSALGWPGFLAPVFFGAGWAVALGSLAVVSLRHRRLLNRCQWYCPSCNEPMISRRGGIARAETAVATGHCPSCGADLFGSPPSEAL